MSNPCNVNTVRCAVCGKLREQANHWFVIWMDYGFHSCPLDIAVRKRDDLPVCGQACAQKEFERWMTGVRNGESGRDDQCLSGWQDRAIQQDRRDRVGSPVIPPEPSKTDRAGAP